MSIKRFTGSMFSSSQWPARIDLHYRLFRSGKLAEFVQCGPIANSGWPFPAGVACWTPETSLAFMDGLGIQTAALSLPNDNAATRTDTAPTTKGSP